MEPVYPVIPGIDLPETTFAKDQPEYNALPSFRDDRGVVLTRWSMTWRERFRALFHGNIYLTVLTYGNPLQPVGLSMDPPEIVRDDNSRPHFIA
ncbi:MAG: hypothetical protein ABI977_16570 [Acidobacteriota bacterium]